MWVPLELPGDSSGPSLRDLKTPWIRKLVFLGIAIAFLSQTTGVNSIMYFAPSVFIATGLDTQAALVATISSGVVSVVGTVLGIYLLHRGVGRRPIIITGQAGLTVALAAIGLLFLLPESATRSYLVLAGWLQPMASHLDLESIPAKRDRYSRSTVDVNHPAVAQVDQALN
jgi:cyanate permease